MAGSVQESDLALRRIHLLQTPGVIRGGHVWFRPRPDGEIIDLLAVDDGKLRELASDLKHLCGAGGSVKDGVVVIQGDHCDALITFLTSRGYTVKKSGG